MAKKARFLVEGVGPATPISIAATRILVARSAPMFELEDRATGGADSQAVHDMRVASRRAREALSALAPAFEATVIDELIFTARAVTRTLGPVRDTEVFIEEFRARSSATTDPQQRIAFAYLLGRRQTELAMARDKMQKRLRKLDLGVEHQRFDELASHTRTDPAGTEALATLAERVLSDRIGIVFTHLPLALEETESAEQHAARIAIKHLRYAVETFACCFDDSFSDAHDMLVAFQDVLGDLHDLDVFIAAVGTASSGDEAAAAGVTRESIEAIHTALATQRAKLHRQFLLLAGEYPETRYREAILGALVPATPGGTLEP